MAEVLRRILYRSYVALNGGALEVDAEIAAILEVSRRNNERDGLTGALLRTRETFTQVLEGPAAPIEATFERICCDLRHRRVQLLEMIETDERAFDGWSMAYIEGGQTFQALIPLMSVDGKANLRHEAARSAVQLMRTCLSDQLRRGLGSTNRSADLCDVERSSARGGSTSA